MTRTLLIGLAAATLLLAGLATPVSAHENQGRHATAHDTYFHPIFGYGPKHGHGPKRGHGKHRDRWRHHGVRHHVSHGWLEHSRYRAWQRELRRHDRHWGRDCVFRHTPHRHVSRRGRIVIDFDW